MSMEPNIFDFLILSIIAISTIFGIYKGFVRTVISFASFVFSIILSFILFPYIQVFVKGYLANSVFLNIASAIIAYIISLLISSLINHKLSMMLEAISGGFFDRMLGCGLGLLRGLLVSLIVFVLCLVVTTDDFIHSKNVDELTKSMQKSEKPDWLNNAITFPSMYELTLVTIDLTPKELVSKIKGFKLHNIRTDKELPAAIKKRVGEQKKRTPNEENYFSSE